MRFFPFFFLGLLLLFFWLLWFRFFLFFLYLNFFFNYLWRILYFFRRLKSLLDFFLFKSIFYAINYQFIQILKIHRQFTILIVFIFDIFFYIFIKIFIERFHLFIQADVKYELNSFFHFFSVYFF